MFFPHRIALAGLLSAALVAAQTAPVEMTPPDAPLADVPATDIAPPPGQPDGDRRPILARVIEVEGDVRWAPRDATEWKPVELDAAYPEGTKILTGVRSRVKFQIGQEEPHTALMVDSVGLTILSEAAITDGDTKRVRVGVGYGRVRAGVAEGGLKSEFTVDSPVATLSKRGTWGFWLFCERGTGVFEIGLDEQGLVEAFRKSDQLSRTLEPGEFVTEVMRRWLDQSSQERNVPVPDILGQGDIAFAFNRIGTDGLGVLGVGQGQQLLLDFRKPGVRDLFQSRVVQALDLPPLPPLGIGNRPEGFFGTGRGDLLIPVIISAADQSATRGAAKQGRYLIRQAAAQKWLAGQR